MASFELVLPGGQVLPALQDNRPHGYPNQKDAISCTFNPEAKEIIYLLHRAEPGEYMIRVESQEQLQEYTVELLQQNMKPQVIQGSASMISLEDGADHSTALELKLSAHDQDTDHSEVRVEFYLDHTKHGHDGIKVGAFPMSDIQSRESVVLDVAPLQLNAGKYYVYAKISDDINVPIFYYFDKPVFLQDEEALPAVTNFRLAPRSGGFEIAIDPVLGDQGDYAYEVVVAEERDPDQTSKSTTIYHAPYRTRVLGLEDGMPYLVSVVAIDAENRKSDASYLRRVVPGYHGGRPLHVFSNPPESVRVGDPYHYQILYQDGDLLEDLRLNQDMHSNIEYAIVGGPRDATIDKLGLFSWRPEARDIGDNEFVISLTRKFLRNGETWITEPHPTIYRFKVHVTETTNLSALKQHPFRFLSDPPHKVMMGGTLSYRPVTSAPSGKLYSIQLVEAPSGVQFNPATQTLEWNQVDTSFGGFVELWLLGPNDQRIDIQRWFLHVASLEGLLNDAVSINKVEVVPGSDPSDQSKHLLIHWDAPEGDYRVEMADKVNGEWYPLNGKPLEGRYGNSTGFRMPSGRLTNFLRIQPVVN